MKNSKKLLSILLSICMIICITSSFTVSALDIKDDVTYSKTSTNTEVDNSFDYSNNLVEYELLPQVATTCDVNYNDKFIGSPNSSTLDTSASYQSYIYFDDNGIAKYYIHFSTHGNSSTHSNPHYHTFHILKGWWTPNSRSISGLPSGWVMPK